MDMVRGDVYLVDLNPTKGAEIKKTRPAVIISPDEMNSTTKTVIIAPLTSTIRAYPFRVECTFQKKNGQLALDQIRSLDKKRLIKKLGKFSTPKINNILSRLSMIFSP
ncbi:MAG: type II toxin-antitoxin system PemK/MazF family toxin [Deltaproteobacteria bacterium]|jgi:mRNA interferase MazF|uniref:type II toxin-antitoxin system PemK/MazF family toxin n=1 Tax=Desulfobacula sp. TaxID=2593537 RepID=UPI001D825FE9|nr:type II toxin-antitoxin system PemK/MazF family toxin [Desulfobacula sp.]MBT7892191.1 type II toxin-antitoxin system PemK/MazF family toxin [Deltaproteobacteria bacterium]